MLSKNNRRGHAVDNHPKFPAQWKPSVPGDFVRGKFREQRTWYRSTPSKFSSEGPVTVVRLEDDHGEEEVWLRWDGLTSAWNSAEPGIGDEMKITFNGGKANANGEATMYFTVENNTQERRLTNG